MRATRPTKDNSSGQREAPWTAPSSPPANPTIRTLRKIACCSAPATSSSTTPAAKRTPTFANTTERADACSKRRSKRAFYTEHGLCGCALVARGGDAPPRDAARERRAADRHERIAHVGEHLPGRVRA